MATNATSTPLDYAEFGAWYDRHRVEVLEPALELARNHLDALLHDALSDRDLARIRAATGRVKSKQRTWRKLSREKYASRVVTFDDVPSIIDDLLGLRLTCTNVRDIEVVQAALDTLPNSLGRRRALAVDPASERDYLLAPKESGYRGYHVNLLVRAPTAAGNRPVTCELQVRTLLQDSWGELTHEETYKPDSVVPPLVEVLSKRMADLLATLDDIAEDLRSELDRRDEEAVADAHVPAGPDSPGILAESGDAAAQLLARWQSMDRPVDLASLAWGLQKDFGTEISDTWFGHRTFKAFLLDAVPEAELTSVGQPYLLPPSDPDGRGDTDDNGDDDGGAGDGGAGDGGGGDVPEAARALKRVDRSFPLLGASQWPLLYSQLAHAWERAGARPPTNRFVNQLTRSARDRATAEGVAVSRRHLDYVAKAVVPAAGAGPLPAAQIAVRFAELTVQRMVELRIVADAAAADDVTRWLGGRGPARA